MSFQADGVLFELTFELEEDPGVDQTMIDITEGTLGGVPITAHLVDGVLFFEGGEADAILRGPSVRNAPNPFDRKTAIGFALSRSTTGSLMIFGPDGRLVRTLAQGVLPAGEHTFMWDGRSNSGSKVGSGIYFAVLRAADREVTHRMLKVR
ncbi:MAG: hypothetical protein GF355_09750 [Candidatus Eisenbacteria bacterium]|nr:hypothetical protein [Candidatus Eisenbacteria bacterium]